MTNKYGSYISDTTYSTECLFKQYVKYWFRYSFFLLGNISNTFLCIGSFNTNAYFPALVSALNSSNDITFGKLIICSGYLLIAFFNIILIIPGDIPFVLAIYFIDKL